MQAGTADDACILTLRARAHNPQWICLSVRDHGDGIDDQTAAQLFKPFFTTRADGMGLGLSVCRTIVEQHGGSLAFVNVRDAAGRIAGVEFSFTLPAAAPAPPTDTEPRQ